MAGELVRFEERAPARRSYDEIERMATAIARSRLFGVNAVEQVIALMLMAEAEGRHVASAMQDYSVIQGRPSLKAEAMLARFQNAGGKVKWTCLTDDRVAAIFAHPSCEPVEIDWDMARAKQAGLGGKDMWRKFPRQMLRARVISEGVRTAYPGALGGMYAPEEVIDFEPVRDVAPSVPNGKLAAPVDAGLHETPSEPPASVKHSFSATQFDDGHGAGKSASRAKKDGDWDRVRNRLLEEMSEQPTRSECEAWWKRVVREDEEYQALPKSFRQMLYETDFLPRLEDLPEVIG